MLKFLPPTNSRLWFVAGLIMAILGFAAFILGQVDQSENLKLIPLALAFLCLGLSYGLLGYFGFRAWLGLAMLGYLTGLGFHIHYLTIEQTSNQELAAFGVFLLFVTGSLALGALVHAGLSLLGRNKSIIVPRPPL